MLAHQGGWDEILLVLVPIAVLFGLLALARRRAARIPRPDGTDSATGPAPED